MPVQLTASPVALPLADCSVRAGFARQGLAQHLLHKGHDVCTKHIGLRAAGRKKDLIAPVLQCVNQRLTSEVPRRANLAGFENLPGALANVLPPDMLIVVKRAKESILDAFAHPQARCSSLSVSSLAPHCAHQCWGSGRLPDQSSHTCKCVPAAPIGASAGQSHAHPSRSSYPC